MFVLILCTIVSKQNVTPEQILYCTINCNAISFSIFFFTITSLEQPVPSKLPPTEMSDTRYLWVTPDDGHSNHPQTLVIWKRYAHQERGTHIQTGKRYAHPLPARQPLMFVNSHKFGRLSKGRRKDKTRDVLSHIINHQNQHLATATLKFRLAKCSILISHICSHPSGQRHYAASQLERATKSRNQQHRHDRNIWHKVSEHNSISYWVEATVMSLRFPDITAEYCS